MASNKFNPTREEAEFLSRLRKEKFSSGRLRSEKGTEDLFNILRDYFTPKADFSNLYRSTNKEEFKSANEIVERTSEQIKSFVAESRKNVVDANSASLKIIELQAKEYHAELEKINETLSTEHKKSHKEIVDLVDSFKQQNENLLRENLNRKRQGVEILPNALMEGVSKQQKAWGEIFDIFRKTKEDVINKFVPSEDKTLFNIPKNRRTSSSIPIEPEPAFPEPVFPEPQTPEQQKLLPWSGDRKLLPYKDDVEVFPPNKTVPRRAKSAIKPTIIDVEPITAPQKLLPYEEPKEQKLLPYKESQNTVIIVDALKKVEKAIDALPEKEEKHVEKLAERIIELNEEEKPIGGKEQKLLGNGEIKDVSTTAAKTLTDPVVTALNTNFDKLSKEIKKLQGASGSNKENEDDSILDNLLDSKKGKGFFQRTAQNARILGKKGMRAGKNLARGAGNLASRGISAATGGAGITGLLGTEVGAIGGLGAGAVATSGALVLGTAAAGAYTGYKLEEKYELGTKTLEAFNATSIKDTKEKEDNQQHYNERLQSINSIKDPREKTAAKIQLDVDTLKIEAKNSTGEEKAQKEMLIKRLENNLEKIKNQKAEEKKAAEVKIQELSISKDAKTPSSATSVLPSSVSSISTSSVADVKKTTSSPETPNNGASLRLDGDSLLKGVEKGKVGTELATINENLKRLIAVMVEKDMGTTVVASASKPTPNNTNYNSSRVLSLRDQLRPA